jgi:hypothetical protein
MSIKGSDRTAELSGIYSRYFVEDFVTTVMGNIAASHPLAPDAIQNIVTTIVNDQAPLELKTVNTATRFIHECAAYAAANDMEDAESRDVWNVLVAAPSLHHTELQELTYTSACLYHKAMQDTVVGVLAKDASIASQTILAGAQSRVSDVETGGTVQVFDWGILNEGMWLNGALLRARDITGKFQPGTEAMSFDGTTALDFARQLVGTPILERDARDLLNAEVTTLVSQVELSNAPGDVGLEDLQALMFKPGALSHAFEEWELATRKTQTLMLQTEKLSSLARVLPKLKAAANDETMRSQLSAATLDRLDQVSDVVTLTLASYHTLRETKFAESLVMTVSPKDNGPTVNVVVNGDKLQQYHQTGGEDEDLVRFGLFYDPRRGLPLPSAGYALEHLVERRTEILAQTIAEDATRLNQIRAGDAEAIQSLAKDVVGNLTLGYLRARGFEELPRAQERAIEQLASKLTDGGDQINLDGEILGILTNTLDNTFLAEMASQWKAELTNNDPKLASARAIANVATLDALRCLGGSVTQ